MDAAVADPRAPLYGRRTAQLEVQPMSFDEVAEFHPDWSFERRAVAYGLFGGVPAYAEQVARHESPREAALALALSPAGPLYAEPEFLVREELRDPGAYFAILARAGGGEDPPERDRPGRRDSPREPSASISTRCAACASSAGRRR